MTRYFYSDEIAAAWMHRHHGLRFQVLAPDGHGVQLFDWTPGQIAMFNQQPKMYVHPDSLNLLEPIDGDVIQDKDNYPFVVDYCGYKNSCTLEEARAWVEGGDKIIQRNGKAFMWPEIGEA